MDKLYIFKVVGVSPQGLDQWNILDLELVDDGRMLPIGNQAMPMLHPDQSQGYFIRAKNQMQAWCRLLAITFFGKPFDLLTLTEKLLVIKAFVECGLESNEPGDKQFAFDNHLREIADLLVNPKLTSEEKLKLIELKLKIEF
jgi:hypothetical protein